MFNRTTRRRFEIVACVFITLACLVPFVGFAVVLGFGLAIGVPAFGVLTLGTMMVLTMVSFFFSSLS